MVLTVSLTYGTALLAIASSTDQDRFLAGMALAGLGFGVYVAVDLALVADLLPDDTSVAKDLGCSTWPARCRSPSHRRSRPSS